MLHVLRRQKLTLRVVIAHLDNLAAVLADAGSGLDRVVKTTVFLIDPRDYAEMDAAYRERFAEPLPAREAVFVAGLPKQARVEISAIACD